MTMKNVLFLLLQFYTAFFKCNIEQQLKDPDAISDILKSLGYTVKERQGVSINKELKSERVIRASFSLYLVQVDLQLIKEIMDHFPNGEFSLKDIVKARSKTSDVEDAVYYLERKAASERQKLEESRGGDASSHGQPKDTHIGRIDTFNLKPDTERSDAVVSTDQNTRRSSKRSVLSKGRGDVAADTDDSSTGSAVSKRPPSVGVRTSFGNTGGRCFTSMNTEQLKQVTDDDLYGLSAEGSQPTQQYLPERYSTVPQAGSLNEAKQHNFDARYMTAPEARPSQYSANTIGTQRHHTVPQVGHPRYNDNSKERMDAATTTPNSLLHHETVTPSQSSYRFSNQSYTGSVRGDPRGHSTVTQSGTVGLLNKVIAGTDGFQTKVSAKTETQVRGSASGDARYVNLGDNNSSAHQKFGSNELDKPMPRKDNARWRDDIGVKNNRTHGSCPEPMEVEQREYYRGSQNDPASFYNGVVEGACAKPAALPGVTDLNATLNHQLTLEPKENLAGKGSKQVTSASSEHKSVAIAQEVTRSKAGNTREAQPSRTLHQNESNVTAAREIAQKTRSSAGDITSYTAKKTNAQRTSPIPSRKTSAQGDRNQNQAHSSKNDLDSGTSPEGRALQTGFKRDATICDLCGLQGTHICRNCFRVVCKKCKEIYLTDLCDSTKGQHAFARLKDKTPQEKSPDSKANVNEGFEDEEKDWSCSRCTYLNPPDHSICVICASSRGVGAVDEARPGSKVCRNCTLNNDEGAKVCVACHKTLSNSETVV